jgi:hypothetical protein
MAIVKANYLPRGRTARAAAKYYTFRDGPDRLTRIWHTSDGRAALYDEVQAELAAGAAAYAYTYRMVLSTQAVDLGPAGYHQALAGRFEHYYFIEHHNTAYPHAHVIGFRHTRVQKAELQDLRRQVHELEQARAQDQQHERSQAQIPSRDQASRAHALDQGLS